MEDKYSRLEREDNNSLFANKLGSIEFVQMNFNDLIRARIIKIEKDLDRILASKSLTEKDLEYINDELRSNLEELELNIGTIMVNCERVTGLRLKFTGETSYRKKRSFIKKGQLLFLLDRNTSRVYGKTLIYLQEELRKVILDLEEDVNRIGMLEERDIRGHIKYLDSEYFKINSDLYQLIDNVNSSIDSIYANISENRDKNINLSFLLISAFLSVILFFPEFNNMLNLKNNELTLEGRVDDIIYEKVIDELKLEDLLMLKMSAGDGSSIYPERKEAFGDGLIENIIIDNINRENERLEREKNRINIFVGLLFIILIPFLAWIVFISI